MPVDKRSEVSFSIPQGMLPWQPILWAKPRSSPHDWVRDKAYNRSNSTKNNTDLASRCTYTQTGPLGGSTGPWAKSDIYDCPLKPIHTATPDTTKLSCARRVGFGGVNWIPDNLRLSPTVNLKFEHVTSNCPIYTATPETIQTGLFCRVWRAVWIEHLT